MKIYLWNILLISTKEIPKAHIFPPMVMERRPKIRGNIIAKFWPRNEGIAVDVNSPNEASKTDKAIYNKGKYLKVPNQIVIILAEIFFSF